MLGLLDRAFFAHAEILRLGAVFTIVALIVAIWVPPERKALGRLGVLYGASLLLRLVAVVFGELSMPSVLMAADFLALLLQGIAFLNLAMVILFATLVRAFRVVPPRILRDLTAALAYLGLVLFLFSTYHVDVTGIVATSAVVTAVIGFSLQDTLANVMGGLALQLDQSIRPGDWVRHGGTTGRVREITWRQTSLETRAGETVLIPNSVLAKSEVQILGLAGAERAQVRRSVLFYVGDQIQPQEVIEAVTEAFTRQPIPNVSGSPLPDVVVVAFESSWVSYGLRYWLNDFTVDEKTDSTVRTRIYYALERAGIPFSIPSQTVLLAKADPQWTAPRRSKDARARHAAIETTSIFRNLTADEKTRLAASLHYAPFAPGEAILLQGNQAHHLFVLTEGSVEVRISVDGAAPKPIARIDAPSFFGEMGLLTGEPRRATVIALTDVECWRVEKSILESLMAERPKIAEEISAVLAEREVELMSAREGLSEQAKKDRMADQKSSILSKIERFFGLH